MYLIPLAPSTGAEGREITIFLPQLSRERMREFCCQREAPVEETNIKLC